MTKATSEPPKLKPFYRRSDVLLSILLVVLVREASIFLAWHSSVLWVAVVVGVFVCARAAFKTMRTS